MSLIRKAYRQGWPQETPKGCSFQNRKALSLVSGRHFNRELFKKLSAKSLKLRVIFYERLINMRDPIPLNAYFTCTKSVLRQKVVCGWGTGQQMDYLSPEAPILSFQAHNALLFQGIWLCWLSHQLANKGCVIKRTNHKHVTIKHRFQDRRVYGRRNPGRGVEKTQ